MLPIISKNYFTIFYNYYSDKNLFQIRFDIHFIESYLFSLKVVSSRSLTISELAVKGGELKKRRGERKKTGEMKNEGRGTLTMDTDQHS